MKVRTDCVKCRERIRKEIEEQMLHDDYNNLSNAIDTAATWAVTGLLAVFVRRGESKEFIEKLYEDMCLLFSTDNLFGKEIRQEDIMKILTDEYGIDFDKLSVNLESEKHFITRYKHNEGSK